MIVLFCYYSPAAEVAALLTWWKETHLHKYLIFTTLNTHAHTYPPTPNTSTHT